MAEEEYKAYPCRGWTFSESDNYPTLTVVAFLIDEGSFSLLFNKEMLEQISEAFAREAKRLPSKTDLH